MDGSFTAEEDMESRPLQFPTLNHRSVRRQKMYSVNRHWKNVIVLGLTFTLCFTAYTAIQNIQSSLNHVDGLGLASLSSVYAAVIVSCIFAPVIISKLTVRWSIIFSLLCYSVYSMANFRSSFSVLIPVSILLGTAAGPLWVAQGTYITTSAMHVAELKMDVPEPIISRFNGVVFAFFQTSQVWGNLISSFLLYNGFSDKGGQGRPTNVSNCGAGVCGPITGSETVPPNPQYVQILFGCFVVCGMLATILALVLLDPLPSAANRVKSDTDSRTTWSLIVSNFSLMKNFQLYLLIPIMIFIGLEQAFLFGDFNKSYVTCTHGVAFVGLVMITFGATGGITSPIIGYIEKVTGRIILFTFVIVLHMALMAFLLVWTPFNDPSKDLWQLFVPAALWGVADALWQTQMQSMLGAIFAGCQEEAFSNYRLFIALGMVIGFVLSIPTFICVWHKLLGIMGWLTLSATFYFLCEYRIRHDQA